MLDVFSCDKYKPVMQVQQLSKLEVEDLLKKGAYGALMDEEDEGSKFCEEDIDQILQRRTQTITIQSEGKGSTFAKVENHRHEAELCVTKPLKATTGTSSFYKRKTSLYNICIISYHVLSGSFCPLFYVFTVNLCVALLLNKVFIGLNFSF